MRTIRRLLVIVLDEDVIARRCEVLVIGTPDDDLDETCRREIVRALDQLQAGRLVIGRDEE